MALMTSLKLPMPSAVKTDAGIVICEWPGAVLVASSEFAAVRGVAGERVSAVDYAFHLNDLTLTLSTAKVEEEIVVEEPQEPEAPAAPEPPPELAAALEPPPEQA